MEGEMTGSGNPDTGNRTPRGGLNDNPGAITPIKMDVSTEMARSESDLVEGQRNDRANAQANRAKMYDHREGSEWEVNPDQTPKAAKAIRPIPSV